MSVQIRWFGGAAEAAGVEEEQVPEGLLSAVLAATSAGVPEAPADQVAPT